MSHNVQEQELKDRLRLIETMIAEGRQRTESWGWTFVLWGAAYSSAIIFANLGAPVSQWTSFGHRTLAWPVAMIGALILMFLILTFTARKSEHQPDTTIGRAVYSIWIAMGISMLLLFPAAGIGCKLEPQMFVAIVAAMLGTTNAASSMILKWRAQFLCALVWWATAVTACLSSVAVSTVVFLAAIFLCQIVFGICGMISEARERKPQANSSEKHGTGAAHA